MGKGVKVKGNLQKKKKEKKKKETYTGNSKILRSPDLGNGDLIKRTI